MSEYDYKEDPTSSWNRKREIPVDFAPTDNSVSWIVAIVLPAYSIPIQGDEVELKHLGETGLYKVEKRRWHNYHKEGGYWGSCKVFVSKIEDL